MMTVLQCHNLCKTFEDGASKVDVLHHVNFAIAEKETVAIVGASGSGKSTLLHLLGGLDKPSQGKITLQDQDITTLSDQALSRLRNQYLGFVYQFHHLLPEFTLLENVALPLLIRKMKTEVAEHEAFEMLKCVGLAKRVQHKLGEVSGGERQRAAIARALVTQPFAYLRMNLRAI